MEKTTMTENSGFNNTSSNVRQLRRQDGVVAGVCGGLGEFFGIDPLWFRLLFLFLMLPGGLPGVLPYLLLWVIIPRK
jgi:phage shock protein C